VFAAHLPADFKIFACFAALMAMMRTDGSKQRKETDLYPLHFQH
jgi:hypothetical protein